ncbi:MAG: hypothetical protein ACREQY_14090 [Candidatus Binatia bacterium]
MRTAEESAAVRFWSFFCERAAGLIAEAGEVLGSHLRETPFSLQNVSREPHHGAIELRAGRTTLRMECPLLCLSPAPAESRLAAMFGEGAQLVRVYVHRESDTLRPVLRSWLAVDPVTGYWASGCPDLGPVPLSDSAAFEVFLWSLLIDTDAE